MAAFTVTAGQRVFLDVDTPLSGGFDPFMRLFDATGAQLAANNDGPTPDEPASKEPFIAFTFATAGT